MIDAALAVEVQHVDSALLSPIGFDETDLAVEVYSEDYNEKHLELVE